MILSTKIEVRKQVLDRQLKGLGIASASILDDFARLVELEWKSLMATALHSTRTQYESRASVVKSPDGRGVYLKLNTTGAPIVGMVEKGVPHGWDLRSTLLKGRPYRRIPLKDHSGTTIARWVTISSRVKGFERDRYGRPKGELMPPVGLQEPHRAKRTVQRLLKTGSFKSKVNSGKFNSWWHPGIDARNLMVQVKNKIATDFPNLVRKYKNKSPEDISKHLTTQQPYSPYNEPLRSNEGVGPLTSWFKSSEYDKSKIS